MVRQEEVDFMNMKIEALEKEWAKLNNNYNARGKSLNKLWEKGKELKKEIAELKKYCGRLTYQISVLHLENRIIVPSETGLIDVQSKQFLVKEIVRQLIDKIGYDLEFDVLQKKYYVDNKKATLTMTGKEVKK